ncbi:calcineurin-like phosphoesterase family protein [Halospina denitrificans]|uniref:Calcineurin-like phosphoesterase family protein n=1 Tax=Halospina denitrificans TaxID=332522 RepID=A0A4R7JM36_9GAMM|nr:metallophosphoesterase [Halospina denitrificans]TDT38576.1 calcineurin-like phosphoesterase family protein [Halospina denitrificans]
MSRVRGYDIIGDIHGCALTLERLLEQMGYSKRQGVYEHPSRTAIFVGDIIDRGPRIREALHLVRDMVDRGSALIVMGNHEYNALGYCTLARPGSGRRHVREHNERHNRLIQATLEQFEHYDNEWHEFLAWFYELPLFLETDRFRVVHACWDERLIRQFEQQHPSGCIDEDFLHASMAPGSFAGRVMDRLLRGTAMKLPDGMTMTGRDGFQRQFFRTRFWGTDAQTYGDIVFQPDPLPESISGRPLSAAERDQLITYGPNERPVFVGHYWLEGPPEPIAPNVACLDYSAVKYGKLVAYRMDDETRLDSQKFVWVDVNPSEQD